MAFRYGIQVLSLIFPTYNESKNLALLLGKVDSALQGVEHEVIIVDDNSPDKTWQIAREMSKTRHNLRVIRRVGRRGLSSAVIEGFLAAKGDVLAVADADGQHDLQILPKMLQAVEASNGIAVGSRYVEGGSVGNWDERRHAMSRMATQMAVRLCKVEVADPMSGFFAVDRAVFERTLPSLNPKGFKILLDLLMNIPASTAVVEVPFVFGLREHGESKLSRRVQIEFLEHLYDATFGRYIPITLVKYCLVGFVGVAVNLLVYLLFAFLYGADARGMFGLSIALLTGIEAAIIFNFLLNNSWTFSTVKLRGRDALFGFIRYNLACAFGALASYAVTSHLLDHGFAEIASVAIGAAVGMIWNYTMSRMFTWKA